MKNQFVFIIVLWFIPSFNPTFAQKIGKCTTRDGGVYFGEIVSKKPSGKGETKYQNGNSYKGDYYKGYRQGWGTYSFYDGEKYEGEWYQDQQHGKGTYHFQNGDIYIGQWHKDFQNGQGIMKYHNGDYYIGSWLYDKRNGRGKYVLADSTIVYEGEWINNVPVEPNLRESFVNGIFRPLQEIASLPQKEWTGTGFAISNKYIVTNYHVVENANTILIKTPIGDSHHGEICSFDKTNDIAIIKLTEELSISTIPYSIKESMSDVGENIFVLGYPLITTMGDEIKLTTGVLSSRTGYKGDIALYQVSAPIQPGNSGGPLFDEQGNIIGIITAKHKDGENVSYAIKSLYLCNLIESTLEEVEIPHKNTISSLKLPSMVKALKNLIFMIYCSD